MVVESKTEVLFLGASGARDAPRIPLCFLELYVTPGAKSGCDNEQWFKPEKQINSVVKI